MAEKSRPITTIESSAERIEWWQNLSEQWKKIFNQAVFQSGEHTRQPSDEQLQQLLHLSVLRTAGPKAPYPNLTFEVADLSGLQELHHLEYLFITFGAISSLRPISHLHKLKALFVPANQLTSLQGIEQMTELRELYCNNNKITTLAPLRQLTQLETLYCQYNELENLDGLTPEHRPVLQQLFVLPNPRLSFPAIQQVEQEVGLRCRRG